MVQAEKERKRIRYLKSFLISFIHSQLRQKRIRKPARIHSPDPFLRAGNAVSVLPNQNPQKNSFGKTESIKWLLRIPSVSPLEKPDLAHHHHTKKRNLNRRQTKQNAWWRGEGGATEWRRRHTVVPDSVV